MSLQVLFKNTFLCEIYGSVLRKQSVLIANLTSKQSISQCDSLLHMLDSCLA